MVKIHLAHFDVEVIDISEKQGVLFNSGRVSVVSSADQINA